MDFDLLWRALLMGFFGGIYGLLGAYLFWKAIQGDITFYQAGLVWIPLLGCFLLIWAGGSAGGWVGGMGSLAYITWIAVRNTQEEKQIREDLIARDIAKWSRTIADDPHNAGAHLFLGHALVERGEMDAAAGEYTRALELDPTNVRALLDSLVRRRSDVEAAIRSRLPDLEQISREVTQRSTLPGAVAYEVDAKAIPHTPFVGTPQGPYTTGGLPIVPGALGVVDGAGIGSIREDPHKPVHREMLGYESEEERVHDQELRARLSDLQTVVQTNPDDASFRLAYAEALEEVEEFERAREQYHWALKLDPSNQKAAAAIARLGEPEEHLQLPEPPAVEAPVPAGLPPLILGNPDLG